MVRLLWASVNNFLVILLALAVCGCTILNGAVGGVTGIGDCTFWKVAEHGPAGLLYLPISPFEGAYHGAQLGWAQDKAVFGNGKPVTLTMVGHTLPCSTNTILKMWTGEGISWNIN